MKIKKHQIIFFQFLLAGLFFSGLNFCQADGPTEIKKKIISPEVWTKNNSPYIIRGSIMVEAELIIEPGTIVKFDFQKGAALKFFDKFNITGTEDNKIIFTSIRDDSFGGDTNGDGGATIPEKGDWYQVYFGPGSQGIFEHAVVSYGSPSGIVMGGVTVYSDNVIIRNSEIKFNAYSGLFIYESQPIIENNTISNNGIGVLAWSSETPKITHNSIVDNNKGAGVSTPFINKLDATDNWWGDESGPYFKHDSIGEDNLEGKGNHVSDGVYFNPWLNKDPNFIRKPVVLIPGIGGMVNWDLMLGNIFNDNWILMSHTYDGIIEAFQAMGYEMDKDLFICYYDWRNANSDSGEDFLKPLIDDAVELNGISKVNVIAHSMGGLVARSYIQSNEYNNDVDHLVLIGTPNKGSSDAYSLWEGGRIPSNWKNKSIMSIYLDYITIKGLAFSNYQAVHQYVPAVGELMPIYDYIHSKGNPEDLKNYSLMNEMNDFLPNLNDDLDILNQRVKVSVISGNEQETVNNIPVVSVNEGDLWVDGRPDPIDPEKNDAQGDGRVLLSSAQIQGKFQDILNYNHGELVSQSEKIIAERFKEDLDVIYPAPDIGNEMSFWFASPLDVEIVAPDGKIISKNTNEIPLAKYSGESKPDGFKLISIPNPVEGDYEINLMGNGDGEYYMGISYFDYKEDGKDVARETQGKIENGEKVEYKIEYDPESDEDFIGDIVFGDTTLPTVTITSPENKEYLNNQFLEIEFEVEDNVSIPENIETKIYLDKSTYSSTYFRLDLALQNLGEHKIKITARDEAENENEETIIFQTTTSLNALIGNIKHYYELGLIKNQKTEKILIKAVEKLEKSEKLIQKIQNNKKMNQKTKDKIIKNIQKKTNRHIDKIIEYINHKSGKLINSKAKELLVESLEFLKY